jgi:tetratricopeptide (TPR) repeat protein
LNLEKARLWRETENEQYLAIPPEQRREVTKSDYFKKSAQYFDAANDAAEVVVKRFPNYKGIGEVYYILAYNHKELGHTDLAHKYFLLSSGKSSAKSDIKLKSNIAIADFNFNAHKYKEAIPFYESALGKIDEKWWTKDSFNLAWCYYRTQQYDKAINLMREVHKKSSNKKYIDLRSQVERDIGIFYVDSGKIKDAVKFYESLGINYTEQFVKIASSITTQGRFSQAESLL